MFGRHKDYFSKKYRRRTYCMMIMCYVTLMSAFRNDEGDKTKERKSQFEDFRYRNYKPFAPHTQVYGFDEIKITWLPVSRLHGYYELYNGDEIEYIGQDLVHIAKRLHPEHEYVFKLRVCSYIPDDCSLFSILRYQIIPKELKRRDRKCNFLQMLSGMKSIPLPLNSLMFLVIVTMFIFWSFIQYIIKFLNEICKIDVIPQHLVKSKENRFCSHSKKSNHSNDTLLPLSNNSSKHYNDTLPPLSNNSSKRFVEFYPQERSSDDISKYKEVKVKIGSKNIDEQETLNQEASLPTHKKASLPTHKSLIELRTLSKAVVKEYTSSSEEHSSCECVGEKGWNKISKKRRRKRCKTISYETEESVTMVTRMMGKSHKSVSDSELHKITLKKMQQCKSSDLSSPPIDITKPSNIVAVIDNSNIFIGARETACNNDPRLRPRHVKLRINQLLHIIEDGRHVTRGITGASSPINTNEHVWDVYRRAGYVVDLEERRGKDEQRVDEQLHLAIYKALVELPSQTLVIATGDGHKGKSKLCTSFIQCAEKAIEHGWDVEVLSWKHCLSVEWLKLASHYQRIKIKYLDGHLEKLTLIEKGHQRKSF